MACRITSLTHLSTELAGPKEDRTITIHRLKWTAAPPVPSKTTTHAHTPLDISCMSSYQIIVQPRYLGLHCLQQTPVINNPILHTLAELTCCKGKASLPREYALPLVPSFLFEFKHEDAFKVYNFTTAPTESIAVTHVAPRVASCHVEPRYVASASSHNALTTGCTFA